MWYEIQGLYSLGLGVYGLGYACVCMSVCMFLGLQGCLFVYVVHIYIYIFTTVFLFGSMSQHGGSSNWGTTENGKACRIYLKFGARNQAQRAPGTQGGGPRNTRGRGRGSSPRNLGQRHPRANHTLHWNTFRQT